MYKIIGGDRKEYGPVTAEQLRQWIAEGRVNAQTSVQAAGATEWKPLSAFPEFVAAFEPATPQLVAHGQSQAGDMRAAALQAVKGPAIALKVTAILGLIAVAFGLVFNILTLLGFQLGIQDMGDPQMQRLFTTLGGGLGIVQNIIGAIMGVVVLMGAAKMQRLQNYQFVLTASILAMLPCLSPCCLFGLPFGIWALVVLNRPEIKSQFE